MNLLKFLFIAAWAFSMSSAYAENHVVEMLDFDNGTTMTFKPSYLKVKPGDSVTFKPTNKTHFVKLMTAPASVQKFTSKENESYTVKLDTAGLYMYVCPPHMMMAMMGVIQVGDAKAFAEQVPANVAALNNLRSRMVINAERADALVRAIKAAQ